VGEECESTHGFLVYLLGHNTQTLGLELEINQTDKTHACTYALTYNATTTSSFTRDRFSCRRGSLSKRTIGLFASHTSKCQAADSLLLLLLLLLLFLLPPPTPRTPTHTHSLTHLQLLKTSGIFLNLSFQSYSLISDESMTLANANT
jgi:hypothetical protein